MRRKAKGCYDFRYDSVDMEEKALGISAPFIPLFKVTANHMSSITRTCDLKSTRLRLRFPSSFVLFLYDQTRNKQSDCIPSPADHTSNDQQFALIALLSFMQLARQVRWFARSAVG